MGSTFSNLLIHGIFSTKHRRPYITPDLQDRLYQYMGGIVREKKGVLYNIGGIEDHVHMLVRWNTTGIVADLFRDVKADSSKWVHDTYPQCQNFACQSGYAVFSVSQSQCEKVNRYIDNQRHHHQKVSFQDELRQLLRVHGVEYDERYIWD